MVRILDRIALAFVYVLGTGKLGTWHDINGGLRYDFPAVYLIVQITRQVVDLIFPEVCQGAEEAGLVAIEGGVANGSLRLVGVAGKAAAKSRCYACQHPGTAVSCLNVLCHKG